jgi:hypothetical protein
MATGLSLVLLPRNGGLEYKGFAIGTNVRRRTRTRCDFLVPPIQALMRWDACNSAASTYPAVNLQGEP